MSSSFGPVQTGQPKFGECRYCWDENFDRDRHFFFEARQHMIGPVCGHRLKHPKRADKPTRISRFRLRQIRKGALSYWERRANLPDYCGEFGEKSLLALAGLHHMSNKDAEAAVARAKQKS